MRDHFPEIPKYRLRCRRDNAGEEKTQMPIGSESCQSKVKFLVKDPKDWMVVLHNDYLGFSVR